MIPSVIVPLYAVQSSSSGAPGAPGGRLAAAVIALAAVLIAMCVAVLVVRRIVASRLCDEADKNSAFGGTGQFSLEELRDLKARGMLTETEYAALRDRLCKRLG